MTEALAKNEARKLNSGFVTHVIESHPQRRYSGAFRITSPSADGDFRESSYASELCSHFHFCPRSLSCRCRNGGAVHADTSQKSLGHQTNAVRVRHHAL